MTTAHHFLFKHPLFTDKSTAKGVPFKKSIYFLWYEHLRRNTDYKHYCQTKKGTKQIAMLYEDFGDIHAQRFKAWWRSNGAELFSEPNKDITRVETLTKGDEVSESAYVLTLAIPIKKQQEWVERQISKQISQQKKKLGLTGRGTPPSDANYKIAMKNPNIKALIKGLEVWDAHQSNPKLSYVELAKKFGFFREGLKDKTRNDAVLRQRVYRSLLATQQIIDNTGKGIFPVHSTRSKPKRSARG